MSALGRIRITDFSGVLAGAGASKILAAFGAQVIRVENPANHGAWDVVRGSPPYIDERRGYNLGGGFNNHNAGKLGITLNLQTERGRELLPRLVAISDIVAENFAAGVMERLGFGYERLRDIKPDIIYLSNCGFGAWGPYREFKTWGPVVQAVSGLTHLSGLPGQPPAGWGFSYMDHTGAYVGAIAMLAALHHRNRTGEGQWIDLSMTESAVGLTGTAILDYTVNGRRSRREDYPDANHSDSPPMAPHAIYPTRDEDRWIAIACRDDADWAALCEEIAELWVHDERFATLDGRLLHQSALDELMARWTRLFDEFELAERLQAAGVPATAVQRPEDRIDRDPNTQEWGLWPEVTHTEMGRVRVEGVPVHASKTDWTIEQGAPCLGEHNREVYGGLLGMSDEEIAALQAEGVI
jgi:crotonobetainyl-CoA:carnitine CoA-transferase CaiB-like acyl-CoA transferase